MKKYWFSFGIIILITLIGCEKSHDDQLNDLSSYVSNNKVGSASDFWLAKEYDPGKFSNVVLFFGFYDNHENCELLKNYYEKTNPVNSFRCVVAN